MTARTSSICNSTTGGSGPRSESPTPRMSNRMSLEKDASRLRYRAHAGHSHMISRLDQIPDEYTRSIGPSPTTWYAMCTPSWTA